MSPSSPRKLISVQNAKSIAGTWIFTILWCGISFTVFWAFAFKARDVVGGAIGGLFALIGLVMLFASVKMTLEYIKYGRVHLTLEGEPPAAGGGFSARLDLPGDAAGATTIHAELACVQSTWSRGSKGSVSKSEKDVWTRKNVFPFRRSTAGGYVTLKFDVPADQPASDLPEESPPDAMLEVGHPAGIEIDHSYYRWELRVKADVPGVDLDRTFKLRVGPAKQAAGARPAVVPVAAPRINPVVSAALEQRLDARRAADRKLGMVCALVGFVPIVAPFALMGLAVGLAGCPMGWSSDRPPSCAFAGIDWGPLMSGAFDLMFIAVPVGIAGSAVIFIVGQLWLDRVHKTDRMGGRAGMAIGLVVLGFFIYQAWQFARPFRSSQPVASQVQQPATAGKDASNVGRGYQAQYVKVTGTDFTAEAHGADLRVRVGEIRLEITGRLPQASYYSLGINIYQRRRDLGSAYDQGVRGTLTAAAPSAVLRERVFVVPGVGAACAQGGCEARLLLGVSTAPNASHGENTDFAALSVNATSGIALSPPGPESSLDPASPLAQAVALYRQSQAHERQKNTAGQEQALLAALEILEKYPAAEARKALGTQGDWLDKEVVARRLGDYYWDQRRYDKAYVYFDRAYRYVPEIQLSDFERNRRLARNSAGRMAGACTQGDWVVADQAMKELKERIVKVDAETRKQLEYWINTGEPRLAARKC